MYAMSLVVAGTNGVTPAGQGGGGSVMQCSAILMFLADPNVLRKCHGALLHPKPLHGPPLGGRKGRELRTVQGVCPQAEHESHCSYSVIAQLHPRWRGPVRLLHDGQ